MPPSRLHDDGRPPGGTARTLGLGAPHKVQWIDESPSESPTHGLDEGGLNVSTFSCPQSENHFAVSLL